MDRIDVVIADENILFVEGLKSLLINELDNDFEIIGQAVSGPALMDLLSENCPDLLIMDVKLPERDGLDIIPSIRNLYPNIRILVVSCYGHSKFVKSAFHGGVDGYILKNNDLSELNRAIRELQDGRTYMGEGVSIAPNRLNNKKQYNSEWDLEDAFLLKNYLTKRELEILTQIAMAKNNKQIAKELFISDQTVSVHRKNIMRKLNVSNTASLIKIALDHGLVH
jgi:DNA-binding NarL/FixJ family response regulator